MTDSPALYFILIGVGVTAIGLVVMLYFLNRRRSIEMPAEQVVRQSIHVEPVQTTALSETDIYRQLAVYRNDQSVFLLMAENLLSQVKSKSETLLLRQIVREFDVRGELLDQKIAFLKKTAEVGEANYSIKEVEYKEKEIDHKLQRQSHKLEQKDEIDDLDHEELKKTKQRAIEALSNPPRVPTSEDINRLRDEDDEKQVQEAIRAFKSHKRIKELEEEYLGGIDDDKRKRRAKRLEAIFEDHARKKLEIQNNPMLSVLEKEQAYKALEKEFMRALDDFERSL